MPRAAPRAALIDIRLFRARSFSPSAATQFLTNSMTYGGQLLFPLYLITARGYSPSRAGILLAAMGIGLLCAFPWMRPVDGSLRLPARGRRRCRAGPDGHPALRAGRRP